MSLEETGDNFQNAGYNVLLYDARSIGGSGGLPRNQPDPWRYVEDLSGKNACSQAIIRSTNRNSLGV
jgi:alpha-beta hydrolase superfamily lysophospholipase